jgi:oxygen-independent coproporphyrinogen-3 oxidase
MIFNEFESDGILTFDEKQMQVTSQGTLFVRNIAAALDKRMIHSDKSFSKPV